MHKLTPISSALAALMIASVLSGCGPDPVKPASAPLTSDVQITTDAAAAAEAAAQAAAAEAATAAEVKAAADAAKAKAAADAAAAAKAKAAAAAKAKAAADAAAAAAAPPPAPPVQDIYYENCTAARAAGAAPIMRGEPGYASKLDRDNDGIACE